MTEDITTTAYDAIQAGVVELLDAARSAAARNVNALMTATYWEIGRRIVEFEQVGSERAKYGDALMQRLAKDLTHRFGRGFSKRNIDQMRQFYLSRQIVQTASAQFISDKKNASADKSSVTDAMSPAFPVAFEAFPVNAHALVKLAQYFPLIFNLAQEN